MTARAIEWLGNATPFQPFEICLADARILHVKHPDFVTLGIVADEETVTVFQDENTVEIIDLLLVVSLRYRDLKLDDDE